MLGKDSPILVTGGTGLVGGGIVRELKSLGYTDIMAPDRAELNLLDPASVRRFFCTYEPEYVFLAGAKVGGIKANSEDPVGFFEDNMRTQLNAFEACYHFKAKKVMFLGSSCIYPRDCKQPMLESDFMTGPFEPTNEGYAMAKMAGIRLAKMYHEQRGMTFICPIPCNVYGTGDHFEFTRAHVLSALVRRFADAKADEAPDLTLWGTGSARREFIHVDDLAEALVLLMTSYADYNPINVGTGEDISIRDLAELIKNRVGYAGQIQWDAAMPDGMPLKCMNVTKLYNWTSWRPKVPLIEGIDRLIAEYRERKHRGEI
jgi:GDP-L-fucose synthase